MFSKLKASAAAIVSALVVTGASLTAPTTAQAQDFWIGQMIPMAGSFCPRSTAEANGQLLPISQNNALFSLLGTIYGGDGRTTFALPDMRGRSAVHAGTGPGLVTLQQGQKGGAQFHTLSIAEMPAHRHALLTVQSEGDRARPNSDYLAANANLPYHDGPADGQLDDAAISAAGAGVQFSILDPYVVVRWCVVLEGLYPSRS